MESEISKNNQEWSDEDDLFEETLIPVATSSSSQLANPSPKINAASNNGDDSQHDEQLLVDKESLDHDGDFSDEEFYNASEWNHLHVSPEIKELFQIIPRYRPQIVEIEAKLKPFVLDYIPAVGDIDAFLKIDRPDGRNEILGLNVLDEPSLHQSDPSVLDLRLRSVYKQSSAKAIEAKTVKDASKIHVSIDKWIKDINELHRTKPLPTVSYSKPFPDIDNMLQEWPPEVEEAIHNNGIAPADLQCDLPTFIDVACGLLDIPVYQGSRIQSLHFLFTVYAEICRLQK